MPFIKVVGYKLKKASLNDNVLKGITYWVVLSNAIYHIK